MGFQLGRYRHFKGNEHKLLYVARHSEAMEEIVVYRAREVFASAEGKALLQQWGVEGEWIGIGHCILGYAAEPEKPAAPRLEGRIVRI